MSTLPPPIPTDEPGCRPQPVADTVMPPTYFVWLLVCILLCVVTAVVGLVFSSKVSQRWRMGDVEGARRASEDARLMLLASVVLGLINVPFMMLYFALT